MSLYRIYGDDAHYLNFVIPVKEVISKLGKKNPFHMDRTPKPYAEVWKQSLDVDFFYGDETAGKKLPDIIDNNGKLYLSEKAYTALLPLLSESGEFLPVQHQSGNGYIFNPLKTAESEGAIDKAKTAYDEHGFISHFSFIEDALSTDVFKTELDTYLGVFCSQEFKDLVEKNKLVGISFGEDLSNPIGHAYGVEQ